MSQIDELAEVEVSTIKKQKNVKANDKSKDNGKKSHLTDTVKVGQNKKDGPKKKKGGCLDQQDALTPILKDQKKNQKKGKKKGENEEDEKNDDNTDQSETEDQPNGKEEIQACEQKGKGGKGGGKKEAKANNKFKYSEKDYQILIEYIRDSNKPYNGTTLESNLKGKTQFKKGSIEAALQQGVDEGKIIKKAYGSSLVFWYNQDLLPIVSKEEIEQLTQKILTKQTEASELNQNLRNVTSQLSKIMQEKTDDQLMIDIEKYSSLVQQLEVEQQFYSSEQYVPLDSALVQSIEDKFQKIEGLYKKRKRTCEDAVKELIENMEETKNISQMFEVIGIDEGNM